MLYFLMMAWGLAQTRHRRPPREPNGFFGWQLISALPPMMISDDSEIDDESLVDDGPFEGQLERPAILHHELGQQGKGVE